MLRFELTSVVTEQSETRGNLRAVLKAELSEAILAFTAGASAKSRNCIARRFSFSSRYSPEYRGIRSEPGYNAGRSSQSRKRNNRARLLTAEAWGNRGKLRRRRANI
jgi:hypothetical protein